MTYKDWAIIAWTIFALSLGLIGHNIFIGALIWSIPMLVYGIRGMYLNRGRTL